MNSCHNATKNDRQWCHHFTIFVGQATARMASQENQPSSCDVAGSAMPREDALLNLTSPSWEKSAIPPKKKITSQTHAVSTFPWPFWICFVSVACSELRLMHYGHVTQQLWFRCQVCHCHLMFWMFEMLDVLFMNVFGCCIWICHAAIEKIYIGHLSPVICHLSSVPMSHPMSRSQKPFMKMWKSPLMSSDEMNQWFPSFKPEDVQLETSLSWN